MFFDGQSLNYSPPAYLVGAGKTFPDQTMAPLDLMWVNVAVSGTSWTNLSTTLSQRLLQYLGTKQRTIVVLSGGQSDIMNPESNTGAQAFADLVGYANTVRSAGADYIIATTMPPSTAFDAPSEETARQDYNALLLGGHAAFDAVADVGNAPELQDPLDLDYYYDQLHWTELGASVAAAIVRPKVEEAVT